MIGSESSDSPAFDRLERSRLVVLLTIGTVGTVGTGLLFVTTAGSSRSLEVVAVLSGSSWPVVGLFGLVTQLGDPWFLVLVSILLYVTGGRWSLVPTRRTGAFALAVAFGALGLTHLLKNLFMLSRPPGAGTAALPDGLFPFLESAVGNTVTASGYGFPSGHALGVSAVYGAIAARTERDTRHVRWALLTVVGLLVVSSRLVLGVHYLVDVIAGVVAGGTLLGVALWIGRTRPGRVFALGALVGAGAIATSLFAPAGTPWESGQWFGAALGAGVTWSVVRPATAPEGNTVATCAIGATGGLLWVGTYLLSPPLLGAVVLTGLAASIVVAAPVLAARRSV